jgi:lipopolysaccharide/colanic/teichoic acid biosynthesis glycosyltransferase
VLGCHDAGVTVRSVADLYEELTGRLLLDQLGHTWLMSLPMRSDTSRVYSAFKRGLDLVTATLGLALLGLILPLVTTLVVIDNPGPIFHRQTRVGKYGRTFTLYKLRTMRERAGDVLSWTEQHDQRITRVGRLLRRLHLDELPQAWSVLRGDMSLIGPRPEQPHYVEELRQHIDFYNTRLTVRPGLTGWAQVSHGYGSGVDGTRVLHQAPVGEPRPADHGSDGAGGAAAGRAVTAPAR